MKALLKPLGMLIFFFGAGGLVIEAFLYSFAMGCVATTVVGVWLRDYEMINNVAVYWQKEYYRLLEKYDALMHLYEQEVGPIEDIVAFEKRMMEEFNEEE